jgi:hypothetical protein
MGQRLVVQIKRNNETVSNCYYHWAGIIFDALPKVKKTLDALIEIESKNFSLEEKLKLYSKALNRLALKERNLPFNFYTGIRENLKGGSLDCFLAHIAAGATRWQINSRPLSFTDISSGGEKITGQGVVSLDIEGILNSLKFAEQLVDIHIDYGGEPYANIINLFEVCPEEEWKKKAKREDFIKIPSSLELSHLTKDEMNAFLFFFNEVSFSIPAFEWRDQILIAAAY